MLASCGNNSFSSNAGESSSIPDISSLSSEPDEDEEKTLSFKNSSYEVEVLKTLTLRTKYDGYDDKPSMKFSSSDNAIAYVDETTGVVTGLRLGTVSITVTYSNDAKIFGTTSLTVIAALPSFSSLLTLANESTNYTVDIEADNNQSIHEEFQKNYIYRTSSSGSIESYGITSSGIGSAFYVSGDELSLATSVTYTKNLASFYHYARKENGYIYSSNLYDNVYNFSMLKTFGFVFEDDTTMDHSSIIPSGDTSTSTVTYLEACNYYVFNMMVNNSISLGKTSSYTLKGVVESKNSFSIRFYGNEVDTEPTLSIKVTDIGSTSKREDVVAFLSQSTAKVNSSSLENSSAKTIIDKTALLANGGRVISDLTYHPDGYNSDGSVNYENWGSLSIIANENYLYVDFESHKQQTGTSSYGAVYTTYHDASEYGIVKKDDGYHLFYIIKKGTSTIVGINSNTDYSDIDIKVDSDVKTMSTDLISYSGVNDYADLAHSGLDLTSFVSNDSIGFTGELGACTNLQMTADYQNLVIGCGGTKNYNSWKSNGYTPAYFGFTDNYRGYNSSFNYQKDAIAVFNLRYYDALPGYTNQTHLAYDMLGKGTLAEPINTSLISMHTA